MSLINRGFAAMLPSEPEPIKTPEEERFNNEIKFTLMNYTFSFKVNLTKKRKEVL